MFVKIGQDHTRFHKVTILDFFNTITLDSAADEEVLSYDSHMAAAIVT